MPEAGLEPARPCGRGILSPLRLPISPLRQPVDPRVGRGVSRSRPLLSTGFAVCAGTSLAAGTKGMAAGSPGRPFPERSEAHDSFRRTPGRGRGQCVPGANAVADNGRGPRGRMAAAGSALPGTGRLGGLDGGLKAVCPTVVTGGPVTSRPGGYPVPDQGGKEVSIFPPPGCGSVPPFLILLDRSPGSGKSFPNSRPPRRCLESETGTAGKGRPLALPQEDKEFARPRPGASGSRR